MTRAQPSQQAEPGMRRCKEWSIDVQADAYKCGQGAAWVLAALRMSNARITIFGPITIFVAGLQGPRVAMSRTPPSQVASRLPDFNFYMRGRKDPERPCHAELRFWIRIAARFR